MSEFFLELFSEEIPAGLQKNFREKIFEDFKDFSNKQGEASTELDGDDLNYSFLSKTFSTLSRSQKEKILQVLKNTINLEKTG